MEILSVEHISSLEEKVNALSQKLDSALSGPPPPIAYTNKGLATLFDVSLRTLQDWRDTGIIRYVKVNRVILYRHEDVATMLHEHVSGLFQYDSDTKSWVKHANTSKKQRYEHKKKQRRLEYIPSNS